MLAPKVRLKNPFTNFQNFQNFFNIYAKDTTQDVFEVKVIPREPQKMIFSLKKPNVIQISDLKP